MNYNINRMEKSLDKVLNMLWTTKQNIKKTAFVLLINYQTYKGKGTRNNKANTKRKPNPQQQASTALQPIGFIMDNDLVIDIVLYSFF